MATNIIKNCLITKSDCKIIKPFIDNVKSYQYRLYKGYHPGIDLECKTVYAPCNITMLYQGYDEDRRRCIVLQYDGDICLRFSNLSSISLKNEFQKVYKGDELGKCNKFVHFEILSYFIQSDWRVRVLDREYSKLDPTAYAQPDYAWNLQSIYRNNPLLDDGSIELDDSIQTEFESEVRH